MKTPLAALIVSGVLLAAMVGPIAVAQTQLNVVTSIKPVHSLVAGVMQGIGEPRLIVDGASSPHTYHLRPSQARDLQQATMVFWIGPQLEAFLAKPLDSLSHGATIVSLSQAPGLLLLEQREGGSFESHDHADDLDDDLGQEQEVHTQGKHHDDETDLHSWLDPQNAKALVVEIEKALSAADPAHQGQYKNNAMALTGRLDALITQVNMVLEPVRDRPFVVFHDAYQYFENRFGLSAAGSITVSPDVIAGAERVAEIQDRIDQLDVTCVFAEPQFEPKLIAVVMEGSKAHAGVLDPLGSTIENGPDLYFTLISDMAQNVHDCLSDPK